MRFDLITIFPQYFAPLSLSLLGKAADKGLLTWQVHDLRDQATDRHRTVDAPPYGGGAGMVMRADIWGKAIDRALAAGREGGATKPLLAIPTPSGQRLTQARAQALTSRDQIIVACGRYEGIDARVAQHYRQTGLDVWEFSLGDYVLNGGEVAALALVEAVGRLEPDVVGNPQSLVEESHSQVGLLEYPVYTRPETWQGLLVPQVLRGGNHQQITTWREVAAARRTAQMRPDLIGQLDFTSLSASAREAFALGGQLPSAVCVTSSTVEDGASHPAGQNLPSGWVLPQGSKTPQEVTYRLATPADAQLLGSLARATFPLACPSFIPQTEIAAFMDTNFAPERLTQVLAQENNLIILALSGGEMVGYTWLVKQLGESEAKEAGAPAGVAYLSKCYTLPEYHGTGLAGALLEMSIWQAQAGRRKDGPAKDGGPKEIWLGTNQGNKRALRFYRKHGFAKAGTRHFQVGQVRARDYLLCRGLSEPFAGN